MECRCGQEISDENNLCHKRHMLGYNECCEEHMAVVRNKLTTILFILNMIENGTPQKIKENHLKLAIESINFLKNYNGDIL